VLPAESTSWFPVPNKATVDDVEYGLPVYKEILKVFPPFAKSCCAEKRAPLKLNGIIFAIFFLSP
jgi:hypothetical protein